jgi:hypothetical protein
MDVDLTIRYSDDCLCEILHPGRTTLRRYTGLSPAARTSARASPRECAKHVASMKSLRGRIDGGGDA